MKAKANSFASFAEASAFARRMAQEHNGSVRLVRRANEFIVEGMFPSDLLDQVEPESKQLHLGTKKIPTDSDSRSNHDSAKSLLGDCRLCVECGVVIPSARAIAVPAASRCVKCQSEFEHAHDTRPHISEGLAGTREDNKKMRGQLWGDMRNRGRG